MRSSTEPEQAEPGLLLSGGSLLAGLTGLAAGPVWTLAPGGWTAAGYVPGPFSLIAGLVGLLFGLGGFLTGLATWRAGGSRAAALLAVAGLTLSLLAFA
ncbi:hypothetical protein [Nonomuraea typhae]|uniref:hypothetical protein n=1 Tax=Nonomuraea typhae TaxID=2603600 RepID=UPI0012F90ECE|nr:hypothetical protein [Nonomuraea typhae]